ncbi:MAG: site-specific DNA-methyltransferase [Candidatus Riflebacteria bacterium]|nr:site-specific DNA-methyltransferase [Candidatus Riflebacteria bacterium]
MTDKMDGFSMDIEQAQRDKLQAVFPECFTEGRLDIDKLLSLCGEYITDDFEKYEFKWKGKSDCLRLAQRRSTATLRPCPEESVNFDTTQNLYIEGDNLEVLKLLQKSYFRKVKMIYIDPPYNTGNDFVYEDDFSDPMRRYMEVTQQTTKSNPETMGRYHTNWLNMMYPRLRLAANLMQDDGVIFISIDDNEVDNLKKLCNEVFGEENFVSQLVWERAFSPKNDAKYISNSHDYVLMYAKSIESFQIGRLPRTEEANARYQNPDNDPRGVWMSSDISVKTYNVESDYPITAPSGRVIEPPAGRCWRLSKNAFLERLQDNRIWFGPDGDGVPRIKRFLSELKFDGMAPTSIMFFKEVGHSQEGAQELSKLMDGGFFNGPKPTRLLGRLLRLANIKKNDNDIILDFFSGSATTAHAVMQLNSEDGGNRRFIMVQLPEVCDKKSEACNAGYKNICEIGKDRIRRAGKKIFEVADDLLTIGGIKPSVDIGFRVFKLDSSNMKLWDDTPIEDNNIETLLDRMAAHIDGLKFDRKDSDLVYEILLKMGYSLTENVTVLNIDDLTVYSVGESNSMLVCLQPGITAEHIEKMAVLQPKKIVIAENALADNSAMSNAFYLLENKGIELKTV